MISCTQISFHSRICRNTRQGDCHANAKFCFEPAVADPAAWLVGGECFGQGFGRHRGGKAPLKRIDVIEFAPENVLLIGDGTGSQIIAVQTNDKASAAALPAKIENLNEKLAAKVGAKAEGIELLDMAVNPNSGRVYFALRSRMTRAT